MPKINKKLNIKRRAIETGNTGLKPCFRNRHFQNQKCSDKNNFIEKCQFNHIYESLNIGIVIINEDLQIIDTNQQGKKFLHINNSRLSNKIKYTELKLNTIHEDGSRLPLNKHPAVQSIIQKKSISNNIIGISQNSGDEIKWMKVNALFQSDAINSGSYISIVSFEDMTQYKATQEVLKLTNTNLEIKRASLENKNIVLDGILKQVEKEKQSLALQIQTTIDKIAMPVLNTLDDKLSDANKQYINILKSVLKDIATPFIKSEDLLSYKLTPRELEILSFVKNGLRSKDIARLLNITEGTIRQQRKSIRKKIGISGEKINLSAYLHKK